ncbi:MAG: PAS domain S-box protein [Gammaproteobacteria bacterium]|nr:PAS domain S-box protein [Gammaproteobacteria bacterium]
MSLQQIIALASRSHRVTTLLVILLLACGLILWHTIDQNRTLQHEEQVLLNNTQQRTAASIEHYLAELRHDLNLFSTNDRHHLQSVVDEPYDNGLQQQFLGDLKQMFPSILGFTLADHSGRLILEDYQAQIDPQCRSEILAFVKTRRQPMLALHTVGNGVHFSLLTQVVFPNQQSVILLTSFSPDGILALLNNAALPHQQFVLINRDPPQDLLVGNKLSADNIVSARANAPSETIPISDSHWDLLALNVNEVSFFTRWSTALWAFSLLLLLGSTALWFLRRGDSFTLKQSEQLQREQRRLNHLQQTTISSELSFNEKVRALLVMGLDEYSMEVAILSRVEANLYSIVTAVSPDNTLQPGMSFNLGSTFCRKTLSTRHPIGVESIQASNSSSHPGYNRQRRLAAYLGTTVSVRGKFYGTLNFSSTTAYASKFSADDLRFLQLMAQWIGLEIERRESEQQLHTKNQLLESISRAQSYFISENVQTNTIFAQVLNDLLALTYSNIGFIAEGIYVGDKLQLRLLTINQRYNPSPELEEFLQDTLANARQNDPHNFIAEVMRNGAPLTINGFGNDPNLPRYADGHPMLTAYLGIPLYHGTQMVGMLGLGNSAEGYADSTLYMLAPLVTATANLIWALHNDEERINTDRALRKSEEQLKLALEGANDGLWDWDLASGRTYYSPRWQGMLKFELGEIKPDISAKESLIHPDDLPLAKQRMLLHCNANTPIYQSEHRVRTKDGEWRWILDRGKVVERDRQGKPLRVVGTHTDITARKEAEHAILERETRITAILETAVDGIVTINEKGIIETFNPAAEKIFGYTAGQILGENVKILMPSPERETHAGFIQRYLADNVPMILGKRREVTGQRADGSVFPMQLAVSEMYFGKQRYFTGIIRDITHVKEADRLLQDTMALTQGILDSAKLSIISTDARGYIQSFNAAAQEMLGYSEREILGRATPILFHDKDEITQRAIKLSDELGQPIKPDFEVFIAKARVGIADEQQWTYIRKDGSRFPVLLTMTALHDKNDETIGFVAMARDISRQQQAEEEISRFKTTLDMTLDCVFMFSPETLRFFYINQGAMEQVGYTYNELLRLTPIDLMPEFDQTSFRRLIRPMVEGKRNTITIETHHRSRTGNFIPVEIFLQYIYPVDQEPRFVAIVRDITDRRRTAESLAQAEERARLLLESAGEGIYGLDLDGKTTFVNPAAARMLGYRTNELINIFIHALAHHTRKDGTLYDYETSPIHAAITQGVIQRVYNEVMWRRDGSSFPAEYTVTPIRKNSRISGAVVIFNDITERRRIEQIKNEFISTVSHELRTPLTSIRGSLGLLVGGAGGLLPTQAKTLVNIANKNTERLLLLINDILDMEKIESGKMVFHYKLLNLRQFIDTAVQANQAYGEQFAVRFTVTQCPEDVSIYADEDRLLQVMNNLLSNAAKFSPRGGNVDISAVKRAHKVRIAVTDSGKGIPQVFHKDMFKKFAQADASDTRQLGGTGLGLSISKAIIDQHGGLIDFISRENFGTTFFFDLPEWVQSDMEDPPRLPSSAKYRILICMDDADVAYMLRIVLAQAGFDSDLARTVEQAKELIRDNHYLAVTLDMSLPDEQGQTYDQEGVKLIKEIRRTDSARELPIIVLAATADQTKRRLRGSAFGIIDWLEKPLDESRLLNAVQFIAHHKPGLPRVLHVEDDPIIYEMVNVILRSQVNLVHAPSLADAHKKLREGSYDLVLLDVELTDGSGLDLLKDLSDLDYTPPVVVFSAQEVGTEVNHAVKAALVKSRESRKELINVIMSVIRDHEQVNPPPASTSIAIPN